jgi:hypothetical protein
MLLIHRTALRRRRCNVKRRDACLRRRLYHPTPQIQAKKDPRLSNLGHLIEDDFAVLRSSYQVRLLVQTP